MLVCFFSLSFSILIRSPSFSLLNHREKKPQHVHVRHLNDIREKGAELYEANSLLPSMRQLLRRLKWGLLLMLPLLGAFNATVFDKVFLHEQHLFFKWHEIPEIVGR